MSDCPCLGTGEIIDPVDGDVRKCAGYIDPVTGDFVECGARESSDD